MQKMSGRVFVSLVSHLEPQEILDLPWDDLPERLPVALLDELAPNLRRAVEGLLQRALGIDGFGPLCSESVAAALERAAHWRLGPEVARLESALSWFLDAREQLFAIEDTREVVNGTRGPRDSEYRRAQGAVRSAEREVTDRVTTLVYSRRRLEADLEVVIAERDRSINGATVERLNYAVGLLEEQVSAVDRVVAPFLAIRLEESLDEINQCKSRIRDQERDTERLDNEIQALRRLIERQDRPALRGRQANILRYRRERLSELLRRRAQAEAPIAEDRLLQWLDRFVDVNINAQACASLGPTLGQYRRSLFFLLSKYCEGQENAARSVVLNGIQQSDADQTIRFIFRSERFVLDYFAGKKKEYSNGMSETARMRLAVIQTLEAELLALLRAGQGRRRPEAARDATRAAKPWRLFGLAQPARVRQPAAAGAGR